MNKEINDMEEISEFSNLLEGILVILVLGYKCFY